MFGGQYWPFPANSTAFYRPSELRTSMIDQPQKNNAKDLTELINHNHHNPVLHQSPMTTTARTSPRPSSSSTAASSQVKTKKAWAKSADWTEDERYSLLEAWEPKFSKLRIASQKEKIRIWNEIYSTYSTSIPILTARGHYPMLRNVYRT